MEIFFELINFSFGFKQEAPLFFDNISIQVQHPGLTFIVGKNGVGKSVLFRILQGVIFPGEIVSGILKINQEQYNFANITDRERLYRRSMILHQDFNRMLALSFTGKQNLTFARFSKYPRLQKTVSVEFDIPMIEQFNLPLYRQVKFLSGGQRQMLAMLMVFERSIDLLLLDEPIAALDEHNSEFIMQNLVSLVSQKHICVLAIVHDYNIVQQYAKNLIKISRDDAGIRSVSLQ